MPEIVETHVFNAARAAGKIANGSDVLRATTVVIVERDDGVLGIGAHTAVSEGENGFDLALAAATANLPAPPTT